MNWMELISNIYYKWLERNRLKKIKLVPKNIKLRVNAPSIRVVRVGVANIRKNHHLHPRNPRNVKVANARKPSVVLPNEVGEAEILF